MLLHTVKNENAFFCDWPGIHYTEGIAREVQLMGKADSVTKEYLADNEIFSNMMNAGFFDCEDIVDPEALKPAPTVIPVPDTIVAKYGEKIRDLLKNAVVKTDGKQFYVLFGMESLSYIHYAMPLRSALYEYESYFQQLSEYIAHRRRILKGTSGYGHYLSELTKGFQVMPVFTLAVYLGDRPWDGPCDLFSMLDQDFLRQFGKYIDNYRLHLITPYDLTDKQIEYLNNDNRNVLLFTGKQNSKAEMRKLIEEIGSQNISIRARKVINAVTNAGLPEYEEDMTMCRAIDEIKQEAVEQALAAERRKHEEERNAYKEKIERASMEMIMHGYNMLRNTDRDMSESEIIACMSEEFSKTEEEIRDIIRQFKA